MATLTRQLLSAYDSQLSRLEGAAYEYVAKRISSFVDRFPNATAAQVREFAIEVVDQAVASYGDAASTLAADLYDGMAEAAGAKVGSAMLDASDVFGYIDRDVRYQMRKYLAGDSAGFAEACGKSAEDQVSRRANQTMRTNASRDGLRYARVPMGGETCTFCAMLASRGFVYTSAKAAGEGNHYHKHCRCKVVPGFEGMEVEGYDPDYYKGIYYDNLARDSSGFVDLRGTLRNIDRANASSLGSGGSAGKAGEAMKAVEGVTYDADSPEEVARFVKNYAQEIAGESIEHAYALQADGTVLHSSGDEKSVSLDGLVSAGATVVHNHPVESGEPGSFGADDIRWLSEHADANELVAVSDGVMYAARPTDLTSQASWSVGYNALSIPQLMAADDPKDLVMEVLHELGYVDYRREDL